MSNLFGVLGGVLNIRMLLLAIALILLVLLTAYLVAKNKRARAAKPGFLLAYKAGGKTRKEISALLGTTTGDDLFAYELTPTSAGYHLRFTLHQPTQQPLGTEYELCFLDGESGTFTLRFVREAFGMREPVLGEDLLDAFFAGKLGAVRTEAPQ